MVSGWVTDDGLRVSVSHLYNWRSLFTLHSLDTPVEDSNKDDHQQCLSIEVCYTLTVIDYA